MKVKDLYTYCKDPAVTCATCKYIRYCTRFMDLIGTMPCLAKEIDSTRKRYEKHQEDTL